MWFDKTRSTKEKEVLEISTVARGFGSLSVVFDILEKIE